MHGQQSSRCNAKRIFYPVIGGTCMERSTAYSLSANKTWSKFARKAKDFASDRNSRIVANVKT
jgi:hypothetical protein